MEANILSRKPRWVLLTLPAIGLIAAVHDAHADPEYLGVQYKCDAEHSLVSFAAYDDGWYSTPVMHGYHVLPIGKHTLNCATKHGLIRSHVDVLPPSNGACRGSGSAYIEDVTVKKRNLISSKDPRKQQGTDLNFSCSFISDYFLSRLDVKLGHRDATVSRCIADAQVFPSDELGCADQTIDRSDDAR